MGRIHYQNAQLEALFGRKMWSNVIIEMSKFSYEQSEIDKREEECENYPSNCHDEEYWRKEMNRQIEDRWHIGLELPVVFIDSWSQKKGHEDNPSEQEHFISETQKLWDFAMSHDENSSKML